jgi:hypothetical protein
MLGTEFPIFRSLPVQTAYKVLITNEQKNILHVTYVKELVQWLVEKGIRSAPYVIYYQSTINLPQICKNPRHRGC